MEEILEFQDPPLTMEEELINLIRAQIDYTEKKYYHDISMDNVIDRIEESSVILGKKVVTKYLYNLVSGGYACSEVTTNIEEL